jgi:hypothetical protein
MYAELLCFISQKIEKGLTELGHNRLLIGPYMLIEVRGTAFRKLFWFLNPWLDLPVLHILPDFVEFLKASWLLHLIFFRFIFLLAWVLHQVICVWFCFLHFNMIELCNRWLPHLKFPYLAGKQHKFQVERHALETCIWCIWIAFKKCFSKCVLTEKKH